MNAASLWFSLRVLKTPYQFIIPYSTYAPWINSIDFLTTFKSLSKYALTPILQAWELYNLTQETEKVVGDVIEIGVFKGGTASIIAKKLKEMDSSRKLYLCDTFAGVVKTSKNDSFYSDGDIKHEDESFVEDLIKKTSAFKNFIILKGIFPDETAHLVSSKKFSLVHIDVDVYYSAKNIIDWIWPKMSKGGVLIAQDFGYQASRGVTKIIEEKRVLKDAIFIHNINGNGLLIKK